MTNWTLTRRSWLYGLLGAAANTGSAQPIPQVHPDHPRLFFRREPWGEHNLTLAEVRRRGASFADNVAAEAPQSSEGAPVLAMKYLLTGDETAAQESVRRMKRGYNGGEWTTTQGDQIEAIATAYDWLAGTWPAFPKEDRAEVQDILTRSGQECVRRLSRGASLYHTRMYAWANGALFSGLALQGDRPEAAELIDFGSRYWKERLIPARAHMAGTWFNAMSYGKKYMCRSVFSFLTAWRSATGEDLWKQARESGNNWPETMLLYLMYMLRPDHRYGTYGDIFGSMWGSQQGTRRVVAQAVAETRNPYGQGFLMELEAYHKQKTYDRESRWYQIFEDPSIPARPRSELPLSRLFSPKGLGAVVMRSGWGAGDTWIFFKCGDYGDNHGHFDQGHFEIFRRGQLALDSFYGAKDTIYHNTLLVNDPDNPEDVGNQRKFSRQVHGSFESYMADPIVRTGDILDYRESGDTTYVAGDVTPAYPPEKVRSFTRQVVFLKRKVLVIFDRIRVTSPRLRRRFLIHYPEQPVVDGQKFSWTNAGGQLVVYTALPREAKITPIPLTAEQGPGALREFQEHKPKGRVEVEPAVYDSDETAFLHVLCSGDEGDPAPAFQLRETATAYVLDLLDSELAFGKAELSFRLDPTQ